VFSNDSSTPRSFAFRTASSADAAEQPRFVETETQAISENENLRTFRQL
jgi:hypothetical protein